MLHSKPTFNDSRSLGISIVSGSSYIAVIPQAPLDLAPETVFVWVAIT